MKITLLHVGAEATCHASRLPRTGVEVRANARDGDPVSEILACGETPSRRSRRDGDRQPPRCLRSAARQHDRARTARFALSTAGCARVAVRPSPGWWIRLQLAVCYLTDVQREERYLARHFWIVKGRSLETDPTFERPRRTRKRPLREKARIPT